MKTGVMQKFWGTNGLLIGLVLIVSVNAAAQQPDTLIKKLDSLSVRTDSAGGQNNNINPKAYNQATKLTFPTYFILLGSDFKQIATAPFHLIGKDWRKLGGFAAVAGALAFADKPLQREALRLRNRNATVRNISKQVTNFGGPYEVYTLVALGAYGYIFKHEKIRTTTLLATQSYIASGVVSGVLKVLASRERPYQTDQNAVQTVPRFHGPFYKDASNTTGKRFNSFPSGHTTAAFSAATVYALEYKNKPLIPIMAYSAATLIGLSRITENKHWATDVLSGAALGYLTGRLVVNNYHRYAKIKAPRQRRNSAAFNLQYSNGVIMPGVVYTFR